MIATRLRRCAVASGVALVIGVSSCGGGNVAPTSITTSTTPRVAPTAIPSPTGRERYVTVGFWQEPTCSGDPGNTTAFPLHYGDTQCYSWPGRSGENSASRFACGADSFSYTQWTTLTCSGGQNPSGTPKTVTLTGCTQGVPPTQYARIIDLSGCADAAK